MDTFIRRIEAAPSPAPALGTLSIPARPMNFIFASGAVDAVRIDLGDRRFTVIDASAPNGHSLRKAILDCAHQATTAEPVDTDRRLHSFIAKLSGTMEGLGERELDAALWNLMTTHRQPTADEQLGMDWWNGLTEERRSHWLRVANAAAPFAAWQAFRAAENHLAVDSSLQVVTPDRLIVDEIDRCGTGNPLDQVIAEQPGFVRRELDDHPAGTGMAKPEANAAVGQCGEGDVGITLDDDR